MLGESGFTHDDLLRGHNQYVGRSLKVNGPFYRDAYNWIIALFILVFISFYMARRLYSSRKSLTIDKDESVPGLKK
ncbi:hypothetical protein FG173_10215 [Serratia marcescens]|nr:hypothetical protein FG173_10215 [Serratia marcescens]